MTTTEIKQGKNCIGVCVTYYCHDGEGNFVMSLRGENCRDEQGRWDIGGGGLDFGDTVEETLIREIKEEYCTEVQEFEFLGFRDVHREHDNQKSHWISLDYKVLVKKEQVANGEPHKFDAVEWFTLATLPTPLHSQQTHFFEKYKDQL